MQKLLILLAAVTFLAYMSQKRTELCEETGYAYSALRDPAYIIMVAILVLFAGLRTSFNDTWNYISGFEATPKLSEYLKRPDSYNVMKNPLFYFLESALRTVTDNPQWFIFLTSFFTQVCFVRFFKRYSSNFTFTMFLYLAYGTFCFSLAAIKQVVAMAVITLAIPFLEKKQWLPYLLLVLVATLLHTYAIVFVTLPFFKQRPWKLFTFLVVAAMVVILMNFEEIITEFMDQANEAGKSLADYEVFDDHTINTLRLAVYAVIPAISFLYANRLFRNSMDMDHILVHMSIISLAFMSMGTQAGANMFARMATYFELGTLCCMPWVLNKLFNKRSYYLAAGIALSLFFIYFVYAFGINMDFNQEYKAVSIFKLFA